MCAGCFTGVEAAVVNAAVGAVAVRSGLTRLRRGRSGLARRRAAYRANADFLTGIGLDPDRVLGPPPDGGHR